MLVILDFNFAPNSQNNLIIYEFNLSNGVLKDTNCIFPIGFYVVKVFVESSYLHVFPIGFYVKPWLAVAAILDFGSALKNTRFIETII